MNAGHRRAADVCWAANEPENTAPKAREKDCGQNCGSHNLSPNKISAPPEECACGAVGLKGWVGGSRAVANGGCQRFERLLGGNLGRVRIG